MEPLEAFATNLHRARKAAGMTQEQLSEMSGVDLASIGRIERGERDPGIRTVARLAGGLDVKPEELLRGVPAASVGG